MGDLVWRPDPLREERPAISRFMSEHKIRSYAELIERSRQPDWFWSVVPDHLEIHWIRDFDQVLDPSDGVEWWRWYPWANLNLADNILEPDDPVAEQIAVIHAPEREDGARTYTYRRLETEIRLLATSLRSLEVGLHDRVIVAMPPSAEALVVLLGLIDAGVVAVLVPTDADESRIRSCLGETGATVVFTTAEKIANNPWLHEEPDLVHVVIHHDGDDEGPGVLLSTLLSTVDQESLSNTEPVQAGHPALIVYGSDPESGGLVLSHAGILLRAALDTSWYLDLSGEHNLLWDHKGSEWTFLWSALGTLFHHATLVIAGEADLWESVSSYGITHIGMTTSRVSELREKWEPRKLDSLQVIAAVGPWSPGDWAWYFEQVGQSRLPVISLSGGFDIFGVRLATTIIEEIGEDMVHGPAPGTGIELEEGSLLTRIPSPSMTMGLWRNPDHYLERYWKDGSWALPETIEEEDGNWRHRSEDAS